MSIDGKRMLHLLMDRYENSVLSKEGSARNLKIRFKPSVDDEEYYSDFRAAQNLNEEAEDYEKKGFICVNWQEDDIDEVFLNLEKVEEVYRYLKRVSRSSFETSLLKMMNEYTGCGFDLYLDELRKRISEHQSIKALIYDDLAKQKQVFDVMKELFLLKHEVLERVFSVRVLKDSKGFEKIKSKILMILRRYYVFEEMNDDELLASYNVIKNPAQLIVKGKGTLFIGSSVVHLSDFADGFIISSGQIDKIHQIEIPEKTVVTVENLTSFYECNDDCAMFVYLGGYHNSVRRQFLLKIAGLYPELSFRHFGDIDAGGFMILNHLKEKTGIEFKAVCMDQETLIKHLDKCHPLTSEDVKRLRKLKDDQCFTDVIEYMLDHNIKLEQENVCFHS